MCIVLAKCFYHLDLSKSDKEYSDDLIDKLPIVLKVNTFICDIKFLSDISFYSINSMIRDSIKVYKYYSGTLSYKINSLWKAFRPTKNLQLETFYSIKKA